MEKKERVNDAEQEEMDRAERMVNDVEQEEIEKAEKVVERQAEEEWVNDAEEATMAEYLWNCVVE